MKPYVLTFALSGHELGQHIPSGGANNKDHDDGGDSRGGDQVLGLGKEEREKQNGLKAKVKSIGPFYFSDQDTQRV